MSILRTLLHADQLTSDTPGGILIISSRFSSNPILILFESLNRLSLSCDYRHNSKSFAFFFVWMCVRIGSRAGCALIYSLTHSLTHPPILATRIRYHAHQERKQALQENPAHTRVWFDILGQHSFIHPCIKVIHDGGDSISPPKEDDSHRYHHAWARNGCASLIRVSGHPSRYPLVSSTEESLKMKAET